MSHRRGLEIGEAQPGSDRRPAIRRVETVPCLHRATARRRTVADTRADCDPNRSPSARRGRWSETRASVSLRLQLEPYLIHRVTNVLDRGARGRPTHFRRVSTRDSDTPL